VSATIGCSNSQAANLYQKQGIQFQYPKIWSVETDSKLFDEHTVALKTTTTSVVLVESYNRRILEREQEHKSLKSSLERFARQYAQRDFTAKLQNQEPIKQTFIERDGYTGLKEVQKFSISDKINETSIREYYRLNGTDTVVFVVMDTSKKEINKTAMGLEQILKSLKITKQ